MLRLNKKQWAMLQVADERNFVATIYADIVREYPALADGPTFRDRLDAAYAEAKRIGFTNDRHIVQFLYLEMLQPSFYREPRVSAWLNKKGVPPEQRLDMLLDVVRAKLRMMKKENP